MRARCVHGTHDVHLVVFERLVSFVHVDYVVRVVYPESETISFTRLVTILIIQEFAHMLFCIIQFDSLLNVLGNIFFPNFKYWV